MTVLGDGVPHKTPLNDDRLTDALARRVLGWKVGPDRFIKSGRKWLPKWRFAPLARLEDAFELLDRTACDYTLTGDGYTGFRAEVRVAGRLGKAAGTAKARTITLALARALGLDAPDGAIDGER